MKKLDQLYAALYRYGVPSAYLRIELHIAGGRAQLHKESIEMIRNAKALGLAFIAVAAMSMVAVSAAQATQLHATVGPSAILTGQQTEQHIFQLTTSKAETKCTEATFEGTIQGAEQAQTTAQEVTLTPTYGGCKTAGLNSQVLMNGCKYTITGQHNGQTLTKTAWVDITGCTAGKQIEIKLTGCTVRVPEQTTLSHITFVNVAGTPQTHDVEAQVTVQGITYEFFEGIACPQAHGKPSELKKVTHDGDYTGKATFKAFVDGGPGVEVTHGTHKYNKLVCGTQVGLIVT